MVFPKDVEKRIGAADLCGEKQVGLGTRHVWIDKRTGEEGEGVPVDQAWQGRIEVVPQKGRGIGWIGKGGTEELIVRLVNGFFRNRAVRAWENSDPAMELSRAGAGLAASRMR